MKHAEFRGFVDYCYKELDFADEAKDLQEFRRVKGLFLAIARKLMETAHFMDGLTDEQRQSAHRAAENTYEFAKGFFPTDAVPTIEAAWAATLDYASRFGWPTVVFDILAPHSVFKDQ
jgi:hypothetical protein